MTRQQQFQKLVARMQYFNNHGSAEAYEQAQRQVALFVFRNSHRITVASGK